MFRTGKTGFSIVILSLSRYIFLNIQILDHCAEQRRRVIKGSIEVLAEQGIVGRGVSRMNESVEMQRGRLVRISHRICGSNRSVGLAKLFVL